MFTGIVLEVGTVASLERAHGGARLDVRCRTAVEGAALGSSVAVNGVCLTVTAFLDEGGFRADLMGETLDRTALAELAVGDPVNLEPALRLGDRLGGHLVQGHVDGVGRVAAVEPQDGWTRVRFALPAALAPHVVEKGSITVDGVSLTVVDVDPPGAPEPSFSVGLVPHTLQSTTLGRLRPGERRAVNLEGDVIAKYVARLVAGGVASPYAPSPRPEEAP